MMTSLILCLGSSDFSTHLLIFFFVTAVVMSMTVVNIK